MQAHIYNIDLEFQQRLLFEGDAEMFIFQGSTIPDLSVFCYF